jgi:hypothetical protein
MSSNLGEELDAIMRDLDEAGKAWVAAGYGYDTPEYEAREAVFARLKAWNKKAASRGHPPTAVNWSPRPSSGSW